MCVQLGDLLSPVTSRPAAGFVRTPVPSALRLLLLQRHCSYYRRCDSSREIGGVILRQVPFGSLGAWASVCVCLCSLCHVICAAASTICVSRFWHSICLWVWSLGLFLERVSLQSCGADTIIGRRSLCAYLQSRSCIPRTFPTYPCAICRIWATNYLAKCRSEGRGASVTGTWGWGRGVG